MSELDGVWISTSELRSVRRDGSAPELQRRWSNTETGQDDWRSIPVVFEETLRKEARLRKEGGYPLGPYRTSGKTPSSEPEPHFLRLVDHMKEPWGRYGPKSGQWFREVHLAPRFYEALALKARLIVDLDGVGGYASGFLMEAFGGLQTKYSESIWPALEIRCNDEFGVVEDVRRYIEKAHQEPFRYIARILLDHPVGEAR